jgi:hypothetical protein
VSRLRDNSADFEGAIARASDELGLAPLFVEKDYWVTQVLRALQGRRPGGFVFKGGTSLSKGYGLIERFSEDVDVLVTPASGDSAKKREGLLRTITEEVAESLAVDWLEGREPGHGKWPHRADVLAYPRVVRSEVDVPVEGRGVLLETGSPRAPTSAVAATTTTSTGCSTMPRPVRRWSIAVTSSASSRRCRTSRHGTTAAPRLDPKAALPSAMPSCRRPDRSCASGSRRATRYQDAAGLLPARVSGQWPSFGQVLKRVEQHAALL